MQRAYSHIHVILSIILRARTHAYTPCIHTTHTCTPLHPVIGPLVPFSPISEESGEDGVPSSAALQEGIASLKPTTRPDPDTRSTSKSPDSKSEDQHELQFESSMEIGSGEWYTHTSLCQELRTVYMYTESERLLCVIHVTVYMHITFVFIENISMSMKTCISGCSRVILRTDTCSSCAVLYC